MQADPLIQALSDPACYDHGVKAVRLVETHISWVLLTGRCAYKIKKPVRLPFLDFTTLESRLHFCEEELRLNRRLSPELYLRVVPIGGSRRAPRLGSRPAIEYAVEMREFEPDARADRSLAQGRLGADDIVGLAALIADFHARLPPAPPESSYGRPDTVERTVIANFDELREQIGNEAEQRRLDPLLAWMRLEYGRIEPALRQRKAGGCIRETHGDLHLENLARVGGRLLPFDALEFDPALRWIDVIDEAAFLVMDLMAHDRDDLAFLLLNRYLEKTGDYRALAVLRFYLVHRALVRAKVRAIKAGQVRGGGRESDAAASYVGLAMRLVSRRRPLLLITHGLSGSGKTHVTGKLLSQLPAVRVRSDLERKRLHGLAAGMPSGSGIGTGLYASDASRRTYEKLLHLAEQGLRAGFDMIVDAAFLRRAERASFSGLAQREGAAFVILDCICGEGVLRRRIDARLAAGRDPSEATQAVLDYQVGRCEALGADEAARAVAVRTDREVDAQRLAAAIDDRRGGPDR
jgi:aminoglycoside phosphotransferase family enzyme/predicted kinase